ncbi:MAG: amidohydrolase [Bacilli bacterium]|nr:amidohydrolase [Bacilli bacterium]
MKILFKNARIITMKDDSVFFGDLMVENNRIKFIGDSNKLNETFDRVIDCDGNVLMPGFKNAHSHSAMTFVRSKSDNLSLHDWLFNVIFPYEDHLKPEDIGPLSKLAFLEYLTSGITGCLDQYFYPEVFGKAAKEFGMRSLFIPVYNAKTRKLNEIRKLFEKYNRPEESIVRMGICIHADYTTPKEDIIETYRIMKVLEPMPFFTHLGETYDEYNSAFEKYGMSQLEYLISFGVFDNGGAIFHGVYLTDNDLELLKKYNIILVTNPGSNTKLASGIAELQKYLDAGVTMAIGTDGPASNNCLDFFKEMSLCWGLQKLINKDPKSMPAYEVLKMATVNGAKAMNLPDADVLEVGKLADIIMIDMHQPNMQPVHNVLNNIVYSGSKANIKMTMIDGKILYMDNKFYVNEDVEQLYAEVQQIAERIIKDTESDKPV